MATKPPMPMPLTILDILLRSADPMTINQLRDEIAALNGAKQSAPRGNVCAALRKLEKIQMVRICGFMTARRQVGGIRALLWHWHPRIKQ